MAKDVTVRISHDLGAVEAQRRIASGLERLRASFVDRLTSSDVVWRGSHADVRIAALGQSIDAGLDVEEDSVLIIVRLPWLLAAMSGKVATFLQANGRDVLRIGYDPAAPKR